jgi:hypothetical protein
MRAARQVTTFAVFSANGPKNTDRLPAETIPPAAVSANESRTPGDHVCGISRKMGQVTTFAAFSAKWAK